MLIALTLEDAEQLVNGFNALELRYTNLAQQGVLHRLGSTAQHAR
jgi:hypothetical protein